MTTGPRTAGAKGASYERRIANLFRDQGYDCWRSAGSKSPADVIAMKPGQVLFIQVKGGPTRYGGPARIGTDEWNELLRLARKHHATAIVADWIVPPGKVVGELRLRRITDWHIARQEWAAEPFILDEVAEAAGL